MSRPTVQNKKPMANSLPTDYDTLKQAISDRYGGMSKRLQQVAEYALAHPDDIALETIAVIASRAKVPPSSLIRFSKALGFDGFTRMQRLFRDRLVARTPSYGERIRRLAVEPRPGGQPMPSMMLQDAAATAIGGLERLRDEVSVADLEAAIAILSRARLVHVVAQRRAFPVASYLTYLLQELGRPAHLLDGAGGMLKQQGQAISSGDALVAVSFQPYAPDVAALVEQGRDKAAEIIGITDGPLSPLIGLSDVSFEIVESEAHGFRPLSSAMCLALTLAVSLGHHMASEL